MYPSADLAFDGEATPGATGFFEVTIVDTNELVHSKKNGDGHVDFIEDDLGIQQALKREVHRKYFRTKGSWTRRRPTWRAIRRSGAA